MVMKMWWTHSHSHRSNDNERENSDQLTDELKTLVINIFSFSCSLHIFYLWFIFLLLLLFSCSLSIGRSSWPLAVVGRRCRQWLFFCLSFLPILLVFQFETCVQSTLDGDSRRWNLEQKLFEQCVCVCVCCHFDGWWRMNNNRRTWREKFRCGIKFFSFSRKMYFHSMNSFHFAFRFIWMDTD